MEDNRDETAKKVFLFPVEYFTAPGFLKRFDFDVKRLRTLIRFGNDREIARDSLNAFMTACFSAVTDEDTRTHMHLEFYSTLAYYGEIYSSEQTFENIISNFERTDMRAKLFGKQPMRSFIVYGDVLLKYYGLKNQQSDGWYTSEGFEIITKAKYYILKAYSQSLEGKNKFSKSDQSYCLVLLASCYMHLSRWFEPVYYLNLLKTKNLKDPNFDYLTVLNLDALKDKSCLDYNGQLLLKIIECGDNVVLNAAADDRQKAHVEKIIENAKENIRRAKLTVDKLKKHKDKVESEQK